MLTATVFFGAVDARGASQDTSSRDSRWLAQALRLRQQNDWAGMVAAGRRWIEIAPKDGIGWATLAAGECGMGKRDAALATYKQQEKITPNDAMLYHTESACMSRLSDPEDELRAAQKEVKVAPGAAVSWSDLGNGFQNVANHCPNVAACLQDFRQANAAFERALKIGVTDPGWYLERIAQNEFDLHLYVDSIHHFTQALQYEPRGSYARQYAWQGLVQDDQALKAGCMSVSTSSKPAPNGGTYIVRNQRWTCDAGMTQFLRETEATISRYR